MKKFFKIAAVGMGLILGSALPGMAQDVKEWDGHMFFRPFNPTIRFNGALIFQHKTNSQQSFSFGTATQQTPHLGLHGQAVPLVTNCGTSPTVTANSTDMAGEVTTGSGAGNNCTIVFAVPMANTPWCSAYQRSRAGSVFVQYVNATAVSIQGQTAGDIVGWHCFDRF